jgi:NadR type nicotinamide-nucleotide adenylyltransferase
VRADVHANRHLLDPRVYRHFVSLVVFMGAESTGKSTLSARMAEAYGTRFVPEYGREVWEAKNGDLELEDYVRIAHGHRAREDEAILAANRYLFVDTNAITTMFFSYYYHRDGLPELARLAEACRGRYAHTFLCADDIPFEQDGWRDNAVWRGRLQGLVRNDLAVLGVPYTEVGGDLEARVRRVRSSLEARPPAALGER